MSQELPNDRLARLTTESAETELRKIITVFFTRYNEPEAMRCMQNGLRSTLEAEQKVLDMLEANEITWG